MSALWDRLSAPIIVMRAIVLVPTLGLHWAIGHYVPHPSSAMLEGAASLALGALLFHAAWRFLLPVEHEVRLQREALATDRHLRKDDDR